MKCGDVGARLRTVKRCHQFDDTRANPFRVNARAGGGVLRIDGSPACARRWFSPQRVGVHRNSRGVGRGISPRPQPRTGLASFQASGSPDCLDYWNASALGRTPSQSVAAGASMLPMLLRRFPQSSLDHFHVHREPSRLVNPSVAQNDTSCRPSPCGWLSQPRTTTTAPPLVCLIGET